MGSESLPDIVDFENVDIGKELVGREFPRILTFADVVCRFVEIEIQTATSFSWLEINTMAVLVSHGKPSLTMGQLAARMLRSTRSMTRQIESLRKKGFVKRRRDSRDRRLIYVDVCPSGLEFVADYLNKVKRMEEDIKSVMDEQELKVFRHTLQKLRRRLISEVIEKGKTPGTQ